LKEAHLFSDGSFSHGKKGTKTAKAEVSATGKRAPKLQKPRLGAIRFGGMRSRLDAATVGCQTFGVSEDSDVVGDGGQIGW